MDNKYTLPAKQYVASFDIDAQKTFTPLCPNELPVAEGDQIVPELNKQAQFASVRVASRDAHSPYAEWIADNTHPCLTPIVGKPDMDLYWTRHAIVGTPGFDFIDGLDPEAYDFQSLKGIEVDKHPYGACYHDLANKKSTGVIEFLKNKGITTVICGGLATDYCVLNTVLQLKNAGFAVVLNLAGCRGIAPDTTASALQKMKDAGVTIVSHAGLLKQP